MAHQTAVVRPGRDEKASDFRGLHRGHGSSAAVSGSSASPDVKQSGGALPVTFLTLLNVGILLFGIAVCWLAGALALRGRLVDAVRRE